MRPEDKTLEAHNVVTPKPKVVAIPRPAADGVIALLEDWLEQAKAGDIRGIALIAVFHNGDVESDFDGLTTGLEMIGAIEHVKLDLYNMVQPVDDE